MSESLLLDTHAAIWLLSDRLSLEMTTLIVELGLDGKAFVSPITAWEVGLLVNRAGGDARVRLNASPLAWYERLLANPALRECELTAAIVIASTELPGILHKDPADRFLIATARQLDLALVTRDRKILDYASQGYLKAIAC